MRRKYDPDNKSSREDKNRVSKTQPRGKPQLLTQALERLEANYAAESYRQITTPPTSVATTVVKEWYDHPLEQVQSQTRNNFMTISTNQVRRPDQNKITLLVCKII